MGKMRIVRTTIAICAIAACVGDVRADALSCTSLGPYRASLLAEQWEKTQGRLAIIDKYAEKFHKFKDELESDRWLASNQAGTIAIVGAVSQATGNLLENLCSFDLECATARGALKVAMSKCLMMSPSKSSRR